MLLFLFLAGCDAKHTQLVPSSDPLTFASPYLKYLGRFQTELLDGTELNDKNSTCSFSRRYTTAIVDGVDYTVEIGLLQTEELSNYDQSDLTDPHWLKTSITDWFLYKHSFDRADHPDVNILIKDIYSALCAEYGEPTERYGEGSRTKYANSGKTVASYLEQVELNPEYPLIRLEVGDVWQITKKINLPKIHGISTEDGAYVFLEYEVLLDPPGKESHIQIWYRTITHDSILVKAP